jgi:hypothetical protein
MTILLGGVQQIDTHILGEVLHYSVSFAACSGVFKFQCLGVSFFVQWYGPIHHRIMNGNTNISNDLTDHSELPIPGGKVAELHPLNMMAYYTKRNDFLVCAYQHLLCGM